MKMVRIILSELVNAAPLYVPATLLVGDVVDLVGSGEPIYVERTKDMTPEEYEALPDWEGP